MLIVKKTISQFLFLIILFSASYSGAAAPIVKPANNLGKATQLLFVGNSHLYYNDSLHNHVRRMVIKIDKENKKKYKYKAAMISGAYLDHHNMSSYLTPGQLGLKNPYHYIIMQDNGSTSLTEDKKKRHLKTVKDFSQKIREAGSLPVIYMMHAYVSPHKKADPKMVKKNDDFYVMSGNKINALVIPVALAFEEAYRQNPKIKLHKYYDGLHPDLLGTYLAAATVFESIYGVSSVGNAYDYFGKISSKDKLFLQKVANKTVTSFFNRK